MWPSPPPLPPPHPPRRNRQRRAGIISTSYFRKCFLNWDVVTTPVCAGSAWATWKSKNISMCPRSPIQTCKRVSASATDYVNAVVGALRVRERERAQKLCDTSGGRQMCIRARSISLTCVFLARAPLQAGVTISLCSACVRQSKKRPACD